MEDKTIRLTNFTDINELKVVEEKYKECLFATESEIIDVKHPSLIYGIYSINLLYTFRDRIQEIENSINDIQEKLNNYKGSKLDIRKEIENLNENKNKLDSFKKEAKNSYDFYKKYLTNLAKKADTLNDDTAKKVYIQSSEEVIKIEINIYLNYEKSLILIKERINDLKTYF